MVTTKTHTEQLFSSTHWDWSEDLSVGNAIIDLEHRGLLSMVNALSQAILRCDAPAANQAFTMIENWMHMHFNHKNRIGSIAKIDMKMHKQGLEHAMRELQYLREELMAKEGFWSASAAEHYASHLKNWLIQDHILKLDLPMKQALSTCAYDMEPVEIPRILC